MEVAGAPRIQAHFQFKLHRCVRISANKTTADLCIQVLTVKSVSEVWGSVNSLVSTLLIKIVSCNYISQSSRAFVAPYGILVLGIPKLLCQVLTQFPFFIQETRYITTRNVRISLKIRIYRLVVTFHLQTQRITQSTSLQKVGFYKIWNNCIQDVYMWLFLCIWYVQSNNYYLHFYVFIYLLMSVL